MASDRFQIQQTLGRGGMGVVYRAYDTELGRTVALKTLANADADAIYRFKREFRSLSELSHPNLINLYELVHDEGMWFFTMELLDGSNFLSWVNGSSGRVEGTLSTSGSRAPGLATDRSFEAEFDEAPIDEEATRRRATPPPPVSATGPSEDATQQRPQDDAFASTQKAQGVLVFARLTAALRQLVRGVQALHDAGKQHRDLKPGNVLVTKSGRLVLLDFGLALDTTGREFYQEAAEFTSSSGTPAYMAPERLLGQPATDASDWYAVGVMLYEALTSFKPFQRMSEVVEGQQVRAPIDLAPDVPSELSQLALDLLHRDPAKRPRGAEILARLGDTGLDQTARQFKAAHGEELIGRVEQLGMLDQALQRATTGRCVQVRVQGPSGYGKTALVHHFLAAKLKHKQAVVLSGRCYERESVPYKVFDALIDALSRYLNGLTKEETNALLPTEVGVLTRLFPSLFRVNGVAGRPRTDLDIRDPHELSRRAALALKELFSNIAKHRPLVLYIDDLQWGDLDSAKLLAEVLTPPLLPNVMLVVSYRSEDLKANAVLKQLLDASDRAGTDLDLFTLEVGPLTARESTDLAQRVLGASRPGLERVTAEAAGSPFFLQQLAQYVASNDRALEEGLLTLSDVLKARIALLPDACAQLLRVVAVAGRPLRRDVAVEAAQLGEGSADALNSLRAGHWVRVSGPRLSDTLETYHDKIRETLAGQGAAVDAQAIHRRIAICLERNPTPDAEALSAHWFGAAEPQRAVSYALTAAANAARSLAFDRAAELYRLALSALSERGPERRAALLGLADALKNAGRGPEAARAYLDAAALTEDAQQRLECERGAFEQYLISGYLDEGRALAQQVLTAVGLSMPESRLGGITSLLWRRARVQLRGMSFVETPEEKVSRSDLARLDVCWSMAVGLSLIDTKLGSDFAARNLLFALDAGEPNRLARAMALEAAHLANSDKKRARALIAEAQTLAQRSGNEHALAFVEQNRGFVEYFHGLYPAALVCFDTAAKRMRERCTGVSWELSTCHMMANWCLTYMGEWAELTRRSGQLISEAKTSGDLYRMDALSISQGITTALMRDDVAGARAELKGAADRWTPRGFQVQHYFRQLMTAWVDLYDADAQRGWDSLLQQWPALKQSLLLTVEDVRYRMFFIRGFCALAMPDSPRMRSEVRAAISVARKTPVVGATGVGNVLEAALATREGNPARAITLLEAAVADYQAAGMGLFGAAAAWRRAQLQADAGGVTAARALMLSKGVAQPEKVLRLFAPGFPS